jgi:GNAT superfamily N-acetyltransferase
MTLTVARATEAEAPACIALLPALRETAAEFLIARLDGELAGAAGIIWRNRREGDGFPLDIEVLPARRRRGVGRALAAAAEASMAGEAAGLWSQRRLETGSDAAAFAEACGFAARRRERYFRAEVARVAELATPLMARLRARGHIPEDVRILPLREASLEEVGWLVSAEFGGGPGSALHFLRRAGETGGVDLDRSRVVMQGERMAAVALARWGDDGASLEAAVVAPAWRHGWANAALIEAIAAVGLDGGVREFRFHCGEDVLDTMQLAAKTAAVCEKTAALYYRAVVA